MEIRRLSLDLAHLLSFSSRDHHTTKSEAMVGAQQGRQIDGRACMYLMTQGIFSIQHQ
jgi:hypothetical protein